MNPSLPRPSLVQRVCWLFAGAEMHLLRQCPADFNRQASIGFTIFMTCLFAALSGGYAAWRFTAEGNGDGNWVAAVVFGLVWGVMIFSIDRSMVVTLKKDPTKQHQPWWQRFSQFISLLAGRAALALLLAFLISIPVEVKFFQQEINLRFEKDANSTVEAERKKIVGNSGIETYQKDALVNLSLETAAQTRANAQNAQVPGWSEKRQQADLALDRAANADRAANLAQGQAEKLRPKAYVPKYDADGNPVLNRRGNKVYLHGPTYTPFKQGLAAAKTARNLAQQARQDQARFLGEASTLASNYRGQNQIAANQAGQARQTAQAEQVRITKTIIDKKVSRADSLASIPSFLRQFTALGHAAADDTDVRNPLWLIRALFFIIEILPTLVKLVTPTGEYDWKLYQHEQEFATRIQTNLRILLNKEQQRETADAAIAADYETMRHQTEKALNETVLRETADRQSKLALQKLDEWYQQHQPPPPPTGSTNGQYTNGNASTFTA